MPADEALIAKVRQRLSASATATPDAVISDAILVCSQLVANATIGVEVPEVIVNEAVIAASVEKVNIDDAPNGVLNQVFDNGIDSVSTAVRIGRDPMKAAYPVLAPYISGKFFCA